MTGQARQFDVLSGLNRGLSVAEIAKELGIAHGATTGHMNRLFKKLGATAPGNAIALAREGGWLDRVVQGGTP